MLQNIEKNKIINFFLEKEVLVGPNFINNINEEFKSDEFYDLFKQKIPSDKFLVISNDLFNSIINKKESLDLNWKELDKSKVLKEKEKDERIYNKFMEFIGNNKEKVLIPEKSESFNENEEQKEEIKLSKTSGNFVDS